MVKTFPSLLLSIFPLIFQVILPSVISIPLFDTKTEDKMVEDVEEQLRTLPFVAYWSNIDKALGDTGSIMKHLTKAGINRPKTKEEAEKTFQQLSDETKEKLNNLKLLEIKRLAELHQTADLASRNNFAIKELHDADYSHLHESKEFSHKDLIYMMEKAKNILEKIDNEQDALFKKHEIEKNLKFKRQLANAKNDAERQMLRDRHQKEMNAWKNHRRMNSPLSKTQVEEVWQDQDHLEKRTLNFNAFFKLHDKNDDDQLDYAEVEAVLMTEMNKIKEQDPDLDELELQYELRRMRKAVMREVDTNKDGMLNFHEFMMRMKETSEKDPEWKNWVEENMKIYTEEESAELEKLLEDLSATRRAQTGDL